MLGVVQSQIRRQLGADMGMGEGEGFRGITEAFQGKEKGKEGDLFSLSLTQDSGDAADLEARAERE